MNHDGRRLARVREKIKPLNKTYPSINLRGVNYDLHSSSLRDGDSALRAFAPSLVESQLSLLNLHRVARELAQSKYFSPGAPQRRNKAVTFTAVPFVRGRQEICRRRPILFLSSWCNEHVVELHNISQ